MWGQFRVCKCLFRSVLLQNSEYLGQYTVTEVCTFSNNNSIIYLMEIISA